jgi:hypothetical protein
MTVGQRRFGTINRKKTEKKRYGCKKNSRSDAIRFYE